MSAEHTSATFFPSKISRIAELSTILCITRSRLLGCHGPWTHSVATSEVGCLKCDTPPPSPSPTVLSKGGRRRKAASTPWARESHLAFTWRWTLLHCHLLSFQKDRTFLNKSCMGMIFQLRTSFFFFFHFLVVRVGSLCIILLVYKVNWPVW